MSLLKASTRLQSAGAFNGIVRFYATIPAQATVARYAKNGDPQAVIKCVLLISPSPTLPASHQLSIIRNYYKLDN